MFKSLPELQGLKESALTAYVTKNAAYAEDAEWSLNLRRRCVEIDRTRKSYSIAIK
jgi:hypothetical protein